MGKENKTRSHTGNQTPEQFPAEEKSADGLTTAQPVPATAPEAIDLRKVANFAALKSELLMAEHEIFGGEAPDAFAKVRNRVIARLTRQGKAGIEAGLDLIAVKTGLKEEKHWVRYGTPIAKAMGLSGVSALNHMIKRTEHAIKLPKKILSAMIELGLEPIHGRNKRLINNLPRHFEGTSDQARELVRAEQDRVTQAKREARAKRTAMKRMKGKKSNGVASDQPAQSLSELLRNCPNSERLAVMEAKVAAFNGELATYISGYKLQLVDADFPLYPRMTEDQQTAPLKPGDRSGLASRIIEAHGRDIEAVLGDLPTDEQAKILDYLYKRITQSCAPAVRRGSTIEVAAAYIAPPLQARKGEPLYRPN